MIKNIQYLFLPVQFLFFTYIVVAQSKTIHIQVLVVGTTGGIVVDTQPARSGIKTIIVEQTNWLEAPTILMNNCNLNAIKINQ